MPKLTPDQLDGIRARVEHCADREWIALASAAAASDRAALLAHVATLSTELEDTTAAYQLAQRQLDAHRAGQGTWIHQELGGHTETIHDTTEGN